MKQKKAMKQVMIVAMTIVAALALMMSVQHLSTPASAYTDMWDGSLRRPMQGKGTKDDPYLITSANEFAYLVQNFDNTNSICLHKYYRLECDIDMNWGRWCFGISAVANRTFNAHFDGNGHKISHLSVTVRPDHQEIHAGLFGQLGGDENFEAAIVNLEVDGVHFLYLEPDNEKFPHYDASLGGLVGQIYDHARIENCVVNNVLFKSPMFQLELPKDADIHLGPIVGSYKPSLGAAHGDIANANLPNSYGVMRYDDSNIQGNTDAIHFMAEQGGKRNNFNQLAVRVVPIDGSSIDYEARITSQTSGDYTYRWMLDGKLVEGTNGKECHLGVEGYRRGLSVEVLNKEGKVLGTGGIVVQPAKANIQLASIKSMAGGRSFNIKTAISGEGKELANRLFYEWRDLTDGNKVVGTSPDLIGAKPNHTYVLVGRLSKNKAFATSAICTLNKPIYVCRHGIQTPQEVARYSANGTTTYPMGSDINDGLTPNTAVSSLKRAYELLKADDDPTATPACNVIVIMGRYDEDIWNSHYDAHGEEKNPEFFAKNKAAIITGSYGNIIEGDIVMDGESVVFDADIHFENVNLLGMSKSAQGADGPKDRTFGGLSMYAQNHNLTIGYGVRLDGYNFMDDNRGLADGSNAPMSTIYGGFYNPDFTDYDYEPNTVTVRSGFWGRVVAGGRFTRPCPTSGNIVGSPRHPIRTTLDIDVANAYNKYMNPNDIGMIIGGQCDGSCYAISQINIKGTTSVGRVIGGNIGYGRLAFQEVKGKKQRRPTDSFFGYTEINISGGDVNEIYGTSLGRNGSRLHPNDKNLIDSCATYFYGQSVINISGGNIRKTIYAAGASGITGTAYNDHVYSYDKNMPYVLSNGQVSYGTYPQAKGKMPRIVVQGDSVIKIDRSAVTINISGEAHLYGSVYGGGHGYSNHMLTPYASTQAGDVFGDTHINVSGGIIEGYIFGGGRGSLSYFDNLEGAAYPVRDGRQISANDFCALAQVYGNTHVNITDGEIKGMVFGAGEGSYYREGRGNINQTSFMAAVYGNTHVDISGGTFHESIFGGGNYGDILQHGSDDTENGNAYINISGGHFMNSIFGGGHGHLDTQLSRKSVISDIGNNVFMNISGGEFVYSDRPSRYSEVRHYGIFGSGHTASVVRGSTYIKMTRSMYSQKFLDDMNYHNWNDERPWDYCLTLCGGGYGLRADVIGDTHVEIDLSDMPELPNESLMNISTQALTSLTNIPYQTFGDIFGGGLNGSVHGSTHVDIRGNAIVRNVYGGAMLGNCGLRDRALNGEDNHEHSFDERQYTTGAYVSLHSGRFHRAYGGSLLGNICGETHLTIGQTGDSINNANLYVNRIVGGNDASGTIAGSNNPRYGIHLDILGGNIMGDVYGAGDGYNYNYDQPDPTYNDLRNACVGRLRPHVASVELRLQGSTKNDRLRIKGSVYCGGNNTTVGLFSRDTLARPEWGLRRELLQPNTGSVKLNVGSHITMTKLFMGCNGSNLLRNPPYYTLDGKNWKRGFMNEDDFMHFCRNSDMSLVPQLTFNDDGEFHNNYPIDDRMGDILTFNTPGEMDAHDIIMDSFFGGGYRGSMTSDSCYIYTLPTGVLVNKEVVGGGSNAFYVFTQKDGKGNLNNWRRIGGIAPYIHEYIRTDRVQLNLFNKFRDIKFILDKHGNPSHDGAKVFTGCLDRGIIVGYASLNFHGNLLGNYQLREGETWRDIASEWNSEAGYIYGAGKGAETEIMGNTYINIRGGVFNGEKCIPNALNVFGGGMNGLVVGRSNVSVDIQCEGGTPEDATANAVWGRVYGGGRMGDVCNQSKLLPEFKAPFGAASHVRVWSGLVGDVFGGARMANIEGRTSVEIEDRSRGHFHCIVDRVFGGNDLSGIIGTGLVRPEGKDSSVVTNTYVHITEFPHEDGTYSGFPLVGSVFGGGNGAYGQSVKGDHYTEGALLTRSGDTLKLAGMRRPDVDVTYLDISGGTIWKAFAGSNQGNVRKKSYINVNYKDPDVRAHFDSSVSASCYARGKNVIALNKMRGVFTDNGSVIECPYNIHQLFGGNNETDMIIQPEWNLVRGNVGSLFGGCNQGDVRYYNEEGDQNINPGHGGNPGLMLNLDHPEFYAENVFGGSRMGNVIASRITTDSEGNTKYTPVEFAGNQYGININITDGRYGCVFGGNDITGNTANGTHIDMRGGIVRELYGAGNGCYTYKVSSEVDKVTETWLEDEQRYIYLVPQAGFDVSDKFKKDIAINTYRPNSAKSFIEIGGQNANHMAYVSGAVFCGGKGATILGPNRTPGDVRLDLGDYSVLNNVYVGSNGEHHCSREYLFDLLEKNDVPLGKAPLLDSNGRYLIDHHMDAVAMYSLPTGFHFREHYEKCYIGSFFVGGLYGSLVVHGGLDITFPRTLTIFNKIVGGADRAEMEIPYSQTISQHHVGGILWDGQGDKPTINLDVQCKFIKAHMDTDPKYAAQDYLIRDSDVEGYEENGSPVYGGCFQSGRVEGSVNVTIEGEESEEILF